MTISILHSHADGTIVDGTTRDDAPTIKAIGGWRWSRNLGAWYVPHSRDRLARRDLIERTAEALRAAGRTVTIEIDDAYRPTAEVVADRIERAEDRREALEVKAGRRGEQADELWQRGKQMAEAIPFGQPMLTDHYSYGRDRRYRNQMGRTFERAHEAAKDAAEIGRRAAAVTNHDARRKDPGYLGRKVETLTAEARKVARILSGEQWGHVPTGDYLVRMEAERDRLADELDFYAGHLEAARKATEEAGKVVPSRDTIRKGDMVRNRFGWHLVTRVNAKTVSVATGYSWSETIPYTEIRDVKTPTPEQAARIAEALAGNGDRFTKMTAASQAFTG